MRRRTGLSSLCRAPLVLASPSLARRGRAATRNGKVQTRRVRRRLSVLNAIAWHPYSSRADCTLRPPATISFARLSARKFIASLSHRAEISPFVRSTMTLPSYAASSSYLSVGTRCHRLLFTCGHDPRPHREDPGHAPALHRGNVEIVDFDESDGVLLLRGVGRLVDQLVGRERVEGHEQAGSEASW